jgi:TM2 domain-containing membrane protein YozV
MSATLQQAIAAIKAGDKLTGQRLLAEVIHNDPRNESAWLWMSAVIDSDENRRTCLERVLAINPNNGTARRGLELLRQKQVAKPSQPERQPKPTPLTPIRALQQIKQIEQETAKKCPYCAETIKAEAVICRFCGRDLSTGQPSQQIVVSQSQPTPVQIPPQRLWSPGVAALLSLIIPGAGQIYKGQIGKGLLYLIVVVAGYALFVVPGLILHLLVILDAARGNPYGQYPTRQQPKQRTVETPKRVAAKPAGKQNRAMLLWSVVIVVGLGFGCVAVAFLFPAKPLVSPPGLTITPGSPTATKTPRSDILIVPAGNLRDYVATYDNYTTVNVRKKDGTLDERENDLEELCRDWLFYRDRIVKRVNEGDEQGAAEARQSFQMVNEWLGEYANSDVEAMFTILGAYE